MHCLRTGVKLWSPSVVTKMKHFFSLILSSIVVLSAFIASPSMALPVPLEIKKAVTFVFLADNQGNLLLDAKTNKPVANGTAFFVVVPSELEPTTRSFCYLVTAKHVVRNPDGSFQRVVFVRLDTKEGKAKFVKVPLEENGHSVVSVAADKTVDLAVVPFWIDPNLVDFKAIPVDMLATKDCVKEGIVEGTDVFFTGLYTHYYGDNRNNPIVRFGRVSMLPEDRIEWLDNPGKPTELVELYLLETQSYGGNSGSPVFFFLGADRQAGTLYVGPPVIKLAGVMRGSFGQTLPVQVVQANTNVVQVPVYTQNIGIAAVTPAYLLHEILYSEEVKGSRSQQRK